MQNKKDILVYRADNVFYFFTTTCTVKPVLSGHLKIGKTTGSSMQVQSIAECSPFLYQWFRRRCHLKKKFRDDGRRTDEGGRPITIPHLEPLAQVS